MTDPIHDIDENEPHAPTCGALTRDGDPCRNPPMRGSARCRMHGSSSPQSRRAAERRIAQSEAAQAVAEWGGRTDVTPSEALIELVASKSFETAYWDMRVENMRAEHRAWSIDLDQLHRCQDQLAAYAAASVRAGVDEALIRETTMRAQWLVEHSLRVVELARAHPDLDERGIVRLAITETTPSTTTLKERL